VGLAARNGRVDRRGMERLHRLGRGDSTIHALGLGALGRRRARAVADEDVDREVEEGVEDWRIRGLVIDMRGRIMLYISGYTADSLVKHSRRLNHRKEVCMM